MKILLGEIRLKMGISLRRLEILTGISKSELNRIENNIVSPRINQLEKIAKALSVKVTDLYIEDE